jgi:UDPglucose--hexose-1-phosphate uridylyltransferase
MTPAEIDSIRESSTLPNTAGWRVRVVPNKFPALQIEGDLNRRGMGIYDISNGVGAHELLIETPDHHKDISDLSSKEVEDIIRMAIRRASSLAKDGRFKYIMIFKNYGPSAGASLEHAHIQLIALPMIPKNVAEELQGARHYFEYRERCIFCDIIRQELDEKERLVLENEYFLSFCPLTSRFPFEVWILPQRHNHSFCAMPQREIPFLSSILTKTIAKIKAIFVNPAYNFIIHAMSSESDMQEVYHWHIEIMPKLTRVAGFEWGTGFYIVQTPPELAAKYLREAKAN